MNRLLIQLCSPLIVCLTFAQFAYGMHAIESSKPNTYNKFSIATMIVPGVGGGGIYSFEVIHPAGAQCYPVPPLERKDCDLGQRKCIQQLDSIVKKSNILENNMVLCFGASQGGATVLNYLATLNEDQKQNIAAIVLEGPVTNGNEAIRHTVAHKFPIASYLPFSRVWLPWIAKTQLPAYNPLGKQAIHTSNKLPDNIPVILLHAIGDPEVPINTTRKFYQELIKNGHQNTYLFEVPIEKHLELLYPDKSQDPSDAVSRMNAILRIYDEFGIPFPLVHAYNSTSNTIEPYKPSLEEVSKRIQTSPDAQRNNIQNIIDLTCLCPPVGIGYLAYRAMHRNTQHP